MQLHTDFLPPVTLASSKLSYRSCCLRGALLLSRYQERSCSGLRGFRRTRANAVLDLGSNEYSEMTPWGSLLPPQVVGFHLSQGHKALLFQ